MNCIGSNLSYGTERAELSERRWALPVCDEGAAFPAGMAGLLPVVTRRKNVEKTVYAFVLDEGSEPQEDRPGYAALADAVALINKTLRQAATFARYDFGYVDAVRVGVPEKGNGFTRVQSVPLDAHGEPNPTPLRLYVETSDEPGSPDSLTSVLEYDAAGNPARLVMTEFGSYGDTCKVVATPNAKTGNFSVAKVEEFIDGDRQGRLLYKRGWRHW